MKPELVEKLEEAPETLIDEEFRPFIALPERSPRLPEFGVRKMNVTQDEGVQGAGHSPLILHNGGLKGYPLI